jgi:hypothetical protein
MASYLRSHRKKSGLSQRELADILAMLTEEQVARHERSVATPAFLVGIGYQIVFKQPIERIFPGFYLTVQDGIEFRLAQMEAEWQGSTAKGRKAARIARKLEWLCERRNSQTI